MEFDDIMNWVDLFIIFILIYTVARGSRLGLVLSIFNIFQIILSVTITKSYYPLVRDYIITTPKIYNIFRVITGLILKILFYSKSKAEVYFISNLFSKGL